ncbi:LacI family DNA-binding transcriptional regulator [Cryobacterium roopkundense]|uniref:DNA-binding LacI/PurR family transcriptional regulator n=1 Tax=Cryobacterium roopkundense TaxID=1001240 RepID=A0A7W8ZZ00_9MICO|nr:LacI family DNA-binding transcriptional regulator [Cryobacterium roopkundense]MBB5642602.1 DNA-binding LacI/PurR family transcriptional regulator [Cryobacterium roopkundense]
MATTIRQVADAAGVSIATASRALSGSDAVVPATRDRVLRVAAALDYTPSRLARGLVTGTTGNIGLIFPDITNPFYTSFLAELESLVGAYDMGIVIGDSHENPDRELALVRQMSTQVDRLVLTSSRLTDEQIVAAAGRLPVVLANRRLGGDVVVPPRLSQMVIDVDAGFTAAVTHLHELGHRRLTYLDGPARSWSARQKRTVLSRVCGELGLALTVVGIERPDFAAGLAACADLDPDRATAVLAFNDQVALGALAALRARGIDVPGRISVIGCDDSLPDGLAWPALTTVDSSSRALGALAAAAVLDPESHPTGSVPTRLIVRRSTAVAAALPHSTHRDDTTQEPS